MVDGGEKEEKGLTRREFLKISTIAGTVIVAGTTLGTYKPYSNLLKLESTVQPSGKVEMVPSICRMCTASCSIFVRVRNGVPEAIKGNRYAWMLNEGRICARGNMGIYRTLNPDRLKRPLIRRGGPRGTYNFREAGWEEVIQAVASKLKELKEKGEGWKVITILGEIGCATYHHHLVAFNKTIGSPNVISLPLSTCILPKGLAWGMTGLAGQHSEIVPDYSRTKYYLCFGRNLGGAVAVGQTAKAGKNVTNYKLVVLDPRLGEWAAKADEWVQIKPGTDLAFLLAMINVIVEEGLYDECYLMEYTNAPMLIRADSLAPVKTREIKKEINGNETTIVDFLVYDEASGEFKWASEASKPVLKVRGLSYEGEEVRTVFEALMEHIKGYTPEWASEITGVSAETIRRIATEFATTKPAALETGWNTDKAYNGFQTYRAAAVLSAITGNLLKPGGVILSAAGIDTVLKRAGPPIASEKSVILQAERSVNIVLSDGTEVKGPLLALGHGYVGLEEALKKDKGWVLFVVGANPARTFMGGIFQRLAGLDTVDLVVDIGFYPDDTALYSDIVIPEASYTERSYNISGTPFTPAKVLRAAFAAHNPPEDAECKGMVEILLDILSSMDESLVDAYAAHLAEGLGFGKCKEGFIAAAYDYLKTRKHDAFMKRIIEEQATCIGMDIDKLRREGLIVIKDEEWGLQMNRKILEAGWLNSPTGKVEIMSLKLLKLPKKRGLPIKPEWHPLPTWVPPLWMRDGKLAEDEFIVITGKQPTMSYQSTYDNPLLSLKLTPEIHKRIWIHPAKAEKLGIVDGDVVKIHGEQGKVFIARVWVTEAIGQDVVYIPPHYGADRDVPARRFYDAEVPPLNELMNLKIEPVCGAHLISDFKVRIERAAKEVVKA